MKIISEVIPVTYRYDHSYVRFPETLKTTPEKETAPASFIMDRIIINEEKGKHHLHDHPAVTKSQNVLDSLDNK